MDLSLIKKKKIIIIITAVIAALVVLCFMFFSRFYNPYGNQLDISNLDEFTAGKPTDRDRVNWIKHALYQTVSLNTKNKLDNNSIKDIVIRKDSFSQTLNKSTNVNSVSFIVDIASLKQSYQVSYEWDNDSRYETQIDEYGTQVTCIAIDKLIYGDFKCIDDRITEKGVENYDPVEKILPYKVEFKYTVRDYSVIQDKIILQVDAFVPSWSDRNKTLQEYSDEIKDWLKSKKLNPSDYDINYSY